MLQGKKSNEYKENYVNAYFWRTHQQQEIDYIEDKNGQLRAFEFKWNVSKKVKPPQIFVETYKDSTFEVISKDNFYDFLE